jgi:5-methylcytosine-specific restriction endonuclease McrA
LSGHIDLLAINPYTISMYKQKICIICSKEFTPNSGQSSICSSKECWYERKRRYKRKFYRNNAKKIYQQGLKYLPARLGRQIAMRLFSKLGIPKICQECGNDYRCQVHHIDENPKNNVRENLIMLCQFCHVKAHHPDSSHPNS